jgi:3-deoxy-7-phosphoheptulonate synthase
MDLVQYQTDRPEERPASRSAALSIESLLEPDAFTLIASLPLDAPAQELLAAAETAHAWGARLLRGRAPDGGPATDGAAMTQLMALAACGRATGLACIAEVRTREQAEQASSLVEMLQVGTDDPALLAAARSGLPVLLERGPAATVTEWLEAADELTASGTQVALSAPAVASPDRPDEPGVDLAAVPTVRERSGLPVVVDPSTLPPDGPGSTATVVALTRAAAAVGADGVVIQALPSRAAANGHNGSGNAEVTSLDPTQRMSLTTDLEALAAMSGRRLAARRIRYVGRS